MKGKGKPVRTRRRKQRPAMPVLGRGLCMSLPPINSEWKVNFKMRYQQTGGATQESIVYAQDLSRMLVMAYSNTQCISLIESFKIKSIGLYCPTGGSGGSNTVEFQWCNAPTGAAATPGAGGHGVLTATSFGTSGAAFIKTRPPKGSFQSFVMPAAASGTSTPLFKMFTGNNVNLGILDLDMDIWLRNVGYKQDTTGDFANPSITSSSLTQGNLYVGCLDKTQLTLYWVPQSAPNWT
jgi:hypothetical protein